MTRLHTFIANAIDAGQTVLVYNTRAVGHNAKVKHVKSMDRVALVGDVVYVDGVSVKGKTVCLKP